MNCYAARRAALAAQMRPGAVAVLAAAPTATRNGDSDYPYRHDSYFYYLSGFAEPDSVLVLTAPGPAAPAGSTRAILFCRPRNPEREIWDGPRCGPEQACAALGLDAAYPIDELDMRMAQLLARVPAVYHLAGGSLDAQLRLWLQGARHGGAAPAACELAALLDEMRLFKDDGEQALMRRAAAISAEAHVRAMRATRPGMYEYQIEAELLHTFRSSGAAGPAYQPVVAAGANACVLHYGANRDQARDGDLLLVDAACELDGYAADITRTYPVNGRFSTPQRALYELVLAAQAAALDALAPGRRYNQMHEAALAVLAQGMLDLGLLRRDQTGGLQDVLANKNYARFYMHGTGHWLGMDVHDVGSYREAGAPDLPWRRLQPGMLLTVEPGIYVRPAPDVPEQYWNCGIRIEDEVLVTSAGHTILSSAAPKSVADIEQLMRQEP